MLPTIMSPGPIDLWTRTPRFIAPLSASAPSHHNLSSVDFITNIAESNFRYAQVKTKAPRKHTGALPKFVRASGSDLGRLDLQTLTGACDRDRPRLHPAVAELGAGDARDHHAVH